MLDGETRLLAWNMCSGKTGKKAYFQVEHAVGSPFIEKYLKKELEDKDLMATVSGLDVAFQ